MSTLGATNDAFFAGLVAADADALERLLTADFLPSMSPPAASPIAARSSPRCAT
jgi:hypothetical protein